MRKYDYNSRRYKTGWRSIGPDRIVELIFAGCIVAFSVLQYRASINNARSSTLQMEKVIDTADRINDAADSFSKSSADIGRVTTDAVKELHQQAVDIEKARTSSEAASQKSIGVSIDTLQHEQRAWVYPSSYQLSNEPDADHRKVTIKFFLINTGRTPGLEVVTISRPYHWHGVPPQEDFPGYTGALTKTIIPPGVSPYSGETDSMEMNDSAIVEYNATRANIYFRAKITYRDIFNHDHWMTICAFHVHGEPLNNFQFCGTEIDPESGHK
ncbi:MAG TPA: hypothetical protein VK578_01555 [Edaphobacter sp.]|nr:hypothetical protein [Edaphobacter sp.]